VYSIENAECEKGSIVIEYNSVLDKYFRNKIEENKIDGWTDKVYSCSNIQRKVERDWKMVYLSRKQLNSNGIISWCIHFKPEQEESYQFHRITIQCASTTFDQHAKILCQLQIGDEQIIDIPQSIYLSDLTEDVSFYYNLDSSSLFEYTINEKINRIGFKIILSSSNDNNAWEKA
jgi:hypothetical protein